MFKTYLSLTKPGIIRGNLVTAAAGFLLASKGYIDWIQLVALLVGTSLLIASACVFNNYTDREIDAKMVRTKKRALVEGLVTHRQALIFASVLGLLAMLVLAIGTNWLTVMVGLVGFLDYVLAYAWGKRHTTYGTIIGSISGATPVVAGYTAASNRLDAGAWLLFAILVCWQMPHFYAIAIAHLKEYAAAGLPVLPVKKGLARTKLSMMGYTMAFLLAIALLGVFDYAGTTYLIVMGLAGAIWLWFSIRGFWITDHKAWARQMFHLSLVVLMLFSLMIAIDVYLP